MTAKEAIENINNVLDSPYLYDESIEYQLTTDDIDWLEMAKEALEKQIPKKPTYEDVGNVYGALKRICINCGDVCLVSKDAKPYEHYCRYCGKKFDDWSDTE